MCRPAFGWRQTSLRSVVLPLFSSLSLLSPPRSSNTFLATHSHIATSSSHHNQHIAHRRSNRTSEKIRRKSFKTTPTKYCARYNTTTNQVHMDVYMKIGYHYTRYTLDSSDLYWYCTSIPGFEYTTYVAVRCCWCKRRRPRPQVLNHRNHNRNNN